MGKFYRNPVKGGKLLLLFLQGKGGEEGISLGSVIVLKRTKRELVRHSKWKGREKKGKGWGHQR